ncbi:MAG: FKBP-type peptidyl-prolyl cis-trans isomerase [Candidatus Dojkabacteria bacterium]
MNQRSVIGAFIMIALLACVVVLGNSAITNNRTVINPPFTSQLKDQPTNDLEKLTDTLTELKTETKTQPTDSNSTAVKTGDKIRVNYKGWLATTGAIFDQSFDRGDSGYEFTVGAGVIDGWSQGVVGMKVGEIRRIKVPSVLGYGEAGSPPVIPANADLIFDVELMQIEN